MTYAMRFKLLSHYYLLSAGTMLKHRQDAPSLGQKLSGRYHNRPKGGLTSHYNNIESITVSHYRIK